MPSFMMLISFIIFLISSKCFGESEIIESKKLTKLYSCCGGVGFNSIESYEENLCESYSQAGKISISQEFMSNGAKAAFDFHLEPNEFSCNQKLFRENISVSTSTSRSSYLYFNGYLKIAKDFYAPDEYCVESITSTSIRVKVCPPDCGINRACIPKCCEMDKVYGFGAHGQRGCQFPTSGENIHFEPPLYEDFYTRVSPIEKFKPHYFLWKLKDFRQNCFRNATTFVALSPSVARNISILYNTTYHSGEFRLRKDGALLFRNAIEKKCLVEKEPQKLMCYDGVQDYTLEDGKGFQNLQDEYLIFLCAGWNVENLNLGSHELIYGIVMLSVSVFPLMTSLVYLSLWKKQNVHGWTIAATMGSLFFMYLFQGTAFALGNLGRERIADHWGCVIIAVLAHFFFLCAFSWMTVMCCDLWWTFRSLKPPSHNRRSKGMKRYVKYSIFGWGLPTCFVTTGVVLDFTHSLDDCTTYTVPGYGSQNCYLIPTSQGVYIIYPIAVLMSLNLIFFGVTCFKLLRYRSNRRIATKRETDHWQGFVRFLKIFIVMGVSWSFEVIGWSIDGLNLKWYWAVFDSINILRAIAVFVVYVCKQDIIQLLESKHPRLKKWLSPLKRKFSREFIENTGSTVAALTPIALQEAANYQTEEISSSLH